MKKFILITLGFVSAVVGTLSFASISLAQSEDRSGRLLSDWIKVHLQLVRTTKDVPHVGYSRHFSYTSTAFYESIVPGQKEYRSLSGQLNGLASLPAYTSPASFNAAASGNAAYASMLRFIYGKNQNASIIDSMENVINQQLRKAGIANESIAASASYGKTICQSMIAWCEKDGYDKVNENYVASTAEGMWQPTPPSFGSAAVPHWKNNRCVVNGSISNVFGALPPKYSTESNSEYQKMAKDVYDVSQKLTDEEKQIAWFWDDSPGKYLTVPGHWSSILAQIIEQLNLPLMKSAEAYAKMHLSLHDACIAAWTGKYTHNVLRPVSVIQKSIDANWTPLIETPPHPEFPAAHATLSSAAATGLNHALGNRISFTDNTYAYLGVQPRTFESFEDAAKEAGFSRLFGGIHYRFSIQEGLMIGKRTSENVLTKLKFK